jgi:hypothetical protein
MTTASPARSCDPSSPPAAARDAARFINVFLYVAADARLHLRYSCVRNDVRLHMATDDATLAPPPLMREFGGTSALRAVTGMWVQE